MEISTLDTTLRDGTQGEAVSFTVDDKLAIARMLDDLGIDYIEGGWPGSNPRDKEFFERAATELKLRHARLTAFGSTRFAKNRIDRDPNVRALVEACTPAISIFGKTWDLHTVRALNIEEKENRKLISETVKFLKDYGREVIFDAEHFFDGFTANPDFALHALESAKTAGADILCLCDTNGGTMTSRLAEIVAEVRARFDGVSGIHCHNDSDVAVANSLAAVQAGARHVQGCMNGYGERTGNANLCSILANLELKLGKTVLGPEKLASLTAAARFIADRANLPLRGDQPYVGHSAFAHKGGVHVSAVLKESACYEHVPPSAVGNRQRIVLSDLSGKGNVKHRLDELGLDLTPEQSRELLDRIKQFEHEGYELDTAEGTFELMARQAKHPNVEFFKVDFVEINIRLDQHRKPRATATVGLIDAKGNSREVTKIAHGPVDALSHCLRSGLAEVHPSIADVRLTDYKVRVLDSRGTGSKVRVLIEWTDKDHRSWTTVGVSDNVIDASWRAMLDAVRLELMRLHEKDDSIEKAVEDYCWGV